MQSSKIRLNGVLNNNFVSETAVAYSSKLNTNKSSQEIFHEIEKRYMLYEERLREVTMNDQAEEF